MWFKDFFLGSLAAFLAAIPTISCGVYEGDVYYGIIGVPIFICFLVGCYRIVKIFIDFIYDIQSKRKWRKK